MNPPTERLLSPLPPLPEPKTEPPGRIRLEQVPSPNGGPRWRVFVDGRPGRS